MTEMLVTILAVVLVPIVPAFILFKLLPSTAKVSGPFKGLKINFAGAFAGYFVVALLAEGIALKSQQDEDKYPKYEEFKAAAAVRFDGSAAGDDIDLRLFRLTLYPKIENLSNTIGANAVKLSVTIPVKRASNGAISYPFDSMIVEYPGYFTKAIALADGAVDKDGEAISFPTVDLAAKPTAPVAHQTLELQDVHR